MDILPSQLSEFIHLFRPLMRAEVFDTFTYVVLGLLIGVRLARDGALFGLCAK
jgi:hypothetical protein